LHLSKHSTTHGLQAPSYDHMIIHYIKHCNERFIIEITMWTT